MVSTAALQLGASRYAFEVLGDVSLGSKLADASRQNLLAAHELAAREAAARPRGPQDAHRRAAEMLRATAQPLAPKAPNSGSQENRPSVPSVWRSDRTRSACVTINA